ncbi:hypothetical protein B0H13DRAFT_2269563 [Mycena leptocephala]|nr:hypothetical protein B0H13DRAFT_2269563 [Mycena leptocephala]
MPSTSRVPSLFTSRTRISIWTAPTPRQAHSRASSSAPAQLYGDPERDLPSEFGQFGMTGNSHVPFIQAPPASRITSPASFRDDCTIRTTASSATTLVRAVRRLVDNEDEDEEAMPPTLRAVDTPETRRRTWPSMETLRRRVSGFSSASTPLPAPTFPPRRPPAPPPPARPWPALPRSTSSTRAAHPDAAHVLAVPPHACQQHQQEGTCGAHARRNVARARRVRRSRSFSGFTSMAQQVLAPIAEPEPDTVAELDEVAAEAYNTARGVGRFWVYEEDESDGSAAAGVLERGVERAW